MKIAVLGIDLGKNSCRLMIGIASGLACIERTLRPASGAGIGRNPSCVSRLAETSTVVP
jgi:hypothetical protein